MLHCSDIHAATSACWQGQACLPATDAGRKTNGTYKPAVTRTQRVLQQPQPPQQQHLATQRPSHLGWCITAITFMPRAALCFSAPTTSAATAASNPDVGSSSHSRQGRATSSTPIAARRRCPPLTKRWLAQPTTCGVCMVCTCSVAAVMVVVGQMRVCRLP